MREIYVSTDVETDGPIPGPHSMLSFASAAYLPDKTLLGTFSANLETLPNAAGHPVTMAWWQQHADAWAAARKDPQPPDKAMRNYVAWLKQFKGRPIFVAFPAAYDFMWMYWYLLRFVGESPFGFAALDVKSYAMAVMKTGFREVAKRNMPKAWFDEQPHTHVALDDAIEQGALFCNILAANLNASDHPPPASGRS